MVVCGGEPMTELIGRTVVVAPGSLAAGRFAVADLHKREAALEALAGQVGATS
jgi:Icc-related predicted phosphoesterase